MTPLPPAALPHLIAARDALRRAMEEVERAEHPASVGIGMTAFYVANLIDEQEIKQ